jgi:serine/threonine protein kinase
MRVIGPFRLCEAIARGAHATVHAASRLDAPQQRLACKVAHRAQEHRLHREGAVLRRVRHPNLIEPVGLVDDGEVVALVLPRAACSLSSHVASLDAEEVAGTISGVAGALAALHAAGVAHGDVTAANVLLLEDGRAVLADLGSTGAATPASRAADVAAAARLGTALLARTEAAPTDAVSFARTVRSAVATTRVPDPNRGPATVDEPPTVEIEDRPSTR